MLKIKQNQGWFRKRKIKAVIMAKHEYNWQCSEEKITLQQEWRIFIREYQSSPTELIVSAINESSVKQSAKDGVKQYALDEEGESINEDGAVKLLGGLGEVMARKILYFSSLEDMTFQMNGLKCSNIFGEGNEVINELLTFHK